MFKEEEDAQHKVEQLVFQTSLIAAFVAGMVALFAPCCITFLLPAYLGSVFKEKGKVLFMTLVFGLGIFVVLLPAVLGVALISRFLFDYHNIIYVIGALVMLLVAVVTFLGIKLPMPSLPGVSPQKSDVLSIFTLGVFSGITSACCAPVLIGILTLTFLSPSFFGALAVGGMYVLGMVTPLLLISLFLSGKMPAVTLLRKNVFSLNLLGYQYQVIMSNLIAGLVFFATSILIFILTFTGNLSMDNVDGFTRMIQNSANMVSEYVNGNMVWEVVFLASLGVIFYWIFKRLGRE